MIASENPRRPPSGLRPHLARAHSRLSASLALLRLVGIYGLLCFLLLESLLLLRAYHEAGPGTDAPAPPATAPGMDAPFHGVTVALEQYPSGQARRDALAQLRAAGFGWVRQRLDWGQMEPAPGTFDWHLADAILDDIQAAGLTPVVVLDGSPAWARDPRDRPPTDNPLAPPADPTDFAAFVGRFAARYRDHVQYYQIWDEPNIAPHWGNRLVDPVGYARLLMAAAQAIRAADPDAVILTGALAPTADRGHTAVDEAYFLQRLYAAGAAWAFDVVAIQPFGFGHTPEDPRSRARVLNFRRAQWVRRAMLAAHDPETPIWAVRYGWNRQPNPVWRAVTAEDQIRFTARAVALARREWPWLAGMGWAVHRPAAPPDDPLWGFALVTPEGEETPLLQAWPRLDRLAESPVGSLPFCPQCLWQPPVLPTATGMAVYALGLGLAGLLLLWRAWVALGLLARAGSALLPRAMREWGVWGLALAWVGLILVYHLATWPPLIGACLLLAAALLWHRPQVGVYLLAGLLPFHYRWKDIHLVESVWSLPPAHAVTLTLIPALVREVRRRFADLGRGSLALTSLLALAWLGLSLWSVRGAWHLGGYLRGLADLVGMPLLMFLAVRVWVREPEARALAAGSLAVGGAAAAGLGLLGWIQGGGVTAEGMRRLLGLTFSPNQTALYLERVLFLWAAWLLFHARGVDRREDHRPGGAWAWAGASAGLALTGVALLLTGSRGAWLLGVPAGVVGLFLAARGAIWQGRWPLRRIGLILAILVGVGGLAVAPRLQGMESVWQRLQVWQAAWALWQARPWTGVGPGGFFWSYPAFMLPQAGDEPNLLHPHNGLLELATGWGIGGVVWLACLTAWAVRRTVRGSTDWVTAGLLAGLAAGFAHGLVDAFLALPELAGWLWVVLALCQTTEAQRTQRMRGGKGRRGPAALRPSVPPDDPPNPPIHARRRSGLRRTRGNASRRFRSGSPIGPPRIERPMYYPLGLRAGQALPLWTG